MPVSGHALSTVIILYSIWNNLFFKRKCQKSSLSLCFISTLPVCIIKKSEYFFSFSKNLVFDPYLTLIFNFYINVMKYF